LIAVITGTSIQTAFRRLVAGMVTVCLLCTGFARTGAGVARAQTHTRVPSSAAASEPAPAPLERSDHFLRDAIPAATFAAAQPDTTADDFVLPEEKSKGQIAKEIAVWVLAAAFVAFFIVKVFIENDDEPVSSDDGGKDVPPPQ
jgi:hypothetical protein